MKRVLNPRLPKPGRPVELSADEAIHAVRVLRMGDGDTVEVIDGHGGVVSALLKIRGKLVFLECAPDSIPARHSSADTIAPVTVELAVLKGDAMEWAVEKCVELGVRALVPVLTAHTVVQTGRKGPAEFQARWQKIADQALKQCGRLERMEVALPIPLDERLVQSPTGPRSPRLWCDEASQGESPYLGAWLASADRSSMENLQILIGPEGGWSELGRGLLQTSTTAIGLGPLILRAETAALFAASLAVGWMRSAKA